MPDRAPLHTIEPRTSWLDINWQEIWAHRDLCLSLAIRDIKVRYKQTLLGIAWAVLQPLLGMLLFTLVFARFAKIPTDGVAAPLFYFAGLLGWNLFATIVSGACQSMIDGARIITKVYFPRILVPASVAGYALVNLVVASTLLLLLLPLYDVWPQARILLLPVVGVGILLSALGVGIGIAALNVKYRDFRYVVPFLMQLWLFATPVIYPSSMIPERWRLLAGLNPMAGLIEAFRGCLLGTEINGSLLLVSYAVALVVFVLGVVLFQHEESAFADVL